MIFVICSDCYVGVDVGVVVDGIFLVVVVVLFDVIVIVVNCGVCLIVDYWNGSIVCMCCIFCI